MGNIRTNEEAIERPRRPGSERPRHKWRPHEAIERDGGGGAGAGAWTRVRPRDRAAPRNWTPGTKVTETPAAFENLQCSHTNRQIQVLGDGKSAYVVSTYALKAKMEDRAVDSGGARDAGPRQGCRRTLEDPALTHLQPPAAPPAVQRHGSGVIHESHSGPRSFLRSRSPLSVLPFLVPVSRRAVDRPGRRVSWME